MQTVKLQLARQNATDHPTDSNFKEEEADLKQRYFTVKEFQRKHVHVCSEFAIDIIMNSLYGYNE